MKNPLESLPMTVVLGVIVTIAMHMIVASMAA